MVLRCCSVRFRLFTAASLVRIDRQYSIALSRIICLDTRSEVEMVGTLFFTMSNAFFSSVRRLRSMWLCKSRASFGRSMTPPLGELDGLLEVEVARMELDGLVRLNMAVFCRYLFLFLFLSLALKFTLNVNFGLDKDVADGDDDEVEE